MSKLYALQSGDILHICGEDPVITVLLNTPEANIEYCLSEGNYQVFVFCNYDGDMKLKETGTVKNAEVSIKYLNLERHAFDQDTEISVGKGSTLEVRSIYLGIADKKINYNLINAGSDSEVRISNNVVCLDDASFAMEITGKIEKDARRSKCHQKSRCLTIGNPRKAEILPVLLIDNNDVEASHSLSSGTIGEDVLFYMNSRGLDEKDALLLLLRSYLMPESSFYDGFAYGREIEEIARGKVDDICSM